MKEPPKPYSNYTGPFAVLNCIVYCIKAQSPSLVIKAPTLVLGCMVVRGFWVKASSRLSTKGEQAGHLRGCSKLLEGQGFGVLFSLIERSLSALAQLPLPA